MRVTPSELISRIEIDRDDQDPLVLDFQDLDAQSARLILAAIADLEDRGENVKVYLSFDRLDVIVGTQVQEILRDIPKSP